MRFTAAIAVTLMAGLLAVCTAAAPSRDTAVIVDSGSTNTAGYRIEISSDGPGFVRQNRLGSDAAPKSFSVSAKVVAKFFADLKAARDSKAVGTPCMKSASFGTSTRVQWHEWTSPDLDCPAENPFIAALVHDVNAIRAASGADAMPLNHGIPFGPPHAMGSPLVIPTPTP